MFKKIALKNKALLHCLLSLLLLVPLGVHADWYQAQGSAPLSLGADTARQQALELALTDALLQAGASLTTVQSVTNGALSGQQLDIAAQGELMDYVIMNEQRRQGRLHLTVRADIWPNEKVTPQCTSSYRPGIALSQLALQYPEQARFGQIYELGDAVASRLAQQLKPAVNLMTQLTHQVSTHEQLNRPRGLRQGGDMLAEQQARLLLSGVIEDISVEDGDWIQWRFKDIPRQFALTVTLEDSLTGERLLDQRYQVAAPWPYKKHELVNVHNHSFWQSAYGQSAEQLLKRISRDVVNAQSCMKAVGRILQQNTDGTLMDLGRQAGIKPGDRFSLVHRRQLQPGFYSETSAKAQFVVQQSYADYSILTPADNAARQMAASPGDLLMATK